MMKEEIYADGIGQIQWIVSNNMIHFDFMTLQPAQDGGAPTPEYNERVIMPPQGFLAAYNSMKQLIDKLLAAGILQKNPNANPNAALENQQQG